jgi:hypothetical protein
MSISLNILYGAASVTDEDRERAIAAAYFVLDQHGITGYGVPDAAGEFRAQWQYLGDEDADDDRVQDYGHLTGTAKIWVEAEAAADRALTLGWHDPSGASCSIAA